MATVKLPTLRSKEPLEPTYVPLDQDEEPDDPAAVTCEHAWILGEGFLGRFGLAYMQCTMCNAFRFALPPDFEKDDDE